MLTGQPEKINLPCTGKISEYPVFMQAIVSALFKLSLNYAICICLFTAGPVQALNITREWSLGGASEETFEMFDTCLIAVVFPGVVPPTYLLGYDSFSVTVSDSMYPLSQNAKSVLHFAFDAGFLYFDHVLTVTIPFSSPLIADSLRHPKQYRLYKDPFPYTGFHQWYEDDSIKIDTLQSAIKFVYHHPKYVPLQKVRILPKTKIASSGYPFSFGIFLQSSSGIVCKSFCIKVIQNDYNCRITKRNVVITSDTYHNNKKTDSYRMLLFDTLGRRIEQWKFSEIPAVLSLSELSSQGMYIGVLYKKSKRIKAWSNILSESGTTP